MFSSIGGSPGHHRANVLIAATIAVLAAVPIERTIAGGKAPPPGDNVLGLPMAAIRNQGALVLCGGGTMPDEVYDTFVELAGGSDARIVMIPTAYPFSSLRAAKYRYSGWRDLDVAAVDFLDTDSSDEADDDDFVEPLRKATGVWIGGGEQGRLADLYVGTKVEKEVRAVLERGGVVGGTSAGAAIMSRLMIRYGALNAVVDRGFDLLSRAVVDQHFSERNRKKRLLGALAKRPGVVGLGIDESTALVVQGNHLRVLGESRVTVCQAAQNHRVWIEHLDADEEADLVAIDKSDKSDWSAVRLEFSAEDDSE